MLRRSAIIAHCCPNATGVAAPARDHRRRALRRLQAHFRWTSGPYRTPERWIGETTAHGAAPSADCSTSDNESRLLLYRPFMGSSSRFGSHQAGASRLVTPQALRELEGEVLTHSMPDRVSDHVCIAMVKVLRWVADRLFRERFIHRATMLLSIALAAPAAASVAAHLRTFHKPRQVPSEAPAVRDPPCAAISSREMRGLLSQTECHAVHSAVLSEMADIRPVERVAVLFLQCAHFSVCLAMFLLYPRMGYRLLGYLGEESSVLWTQMVNDIDLGKVSDLLVPQLAYTYWGVNQASEGGPVGDPAESTGEHTTAPTSTEEAEAEGGRAPHPTHPIASTVSAVASNETPGSTGAVEDSASSISSACGTEPAVQDGATVSLSSSNAEMEELSTTPSGVLALTLRDVVLLIRSDEMVYRDLNHGKADALDAERLKRGSWLSRYLK